ncbi:hypothetical protein NDU88_005381 [Pleurodeles waltl]|uniref:Uncharacterized protein n=1 Tax=Pleurodeles waltl TaxID=8319 RepID=A0AAV7UIM0_PLEWA|nr:hypothetical protein NDU88_005381 [Pleurodeles waltl]
MPVQRSHFSPLRIYFSIASRAASRINPVFSHSPDTLRPVGRRLISLFRSTQHWYGQRQGPASTPRSAAQTARAAQAPPPLDAPANIKR